MFTAFRDGAHDPSSRASSSSPFSCAPDAGPSVLVFFDGVRLIGSCIRVTCTRLPLHLGLLFFCFHRHLVFFSFDVCCRLFCIFRRRRRVVVFFLFLFVTEPRVVGVSLRVFLVFSCPLLSWFSLFSVRRANRCRRHTIATPCTLLTGAPHPTLCSTAPQAGADAE